MTEADLKRIELRLERLEDLAKEELENDGNTLFAEEVTGFTAELLAIVRGEDSTFDEID